MPTPTDRATPLDVRRTLAVVAAENGWHTGTCDRAFGAGNNPRPPTLILARGGELLFAEVTTTDRHRQPLRDEAAWWFAFAEAMGGEGLRVCPGTLEAALDRVRQEPKP